MPPAYGSPKDGPRLWGHSTTKDTDQLTNGFRATHRPTRVGAYGQMGRTSAKYPTSPPVAHTYGMGGG